MVMMDLERVEDNPDANFKDKNKNMSRQKFISISEKRLKENREELTEKMMDVEGVEDDGDAIMKFIATKTERLVFTWPIR